MTEIQKIREKKNPSEYQKWYSLAAALGLLFCAMMQSTVPNHQIGVIACLWLSILICMGGYRVSDRRLHKELVQEIDTLRRELEQLKTSQ